MKSFGFAILTSTLMVSISEMAVGSGGKEFANRSAFDIALVLDNIDTGRFFNTGVKDSVRVSPMPQLPMEMIDISGNRVNNVIALNWEMSSLSRLYHFEIQRSLYTVNFKTIAVVSAAGEQYNYSFTDSDICESTGPYYYRVKMLEMSGDSSYSPVINIPVLTANGSETSVNINPKPNDRVMINMSIPFASKVTIEIENPAGQNIYRKEINQFSGVSSQQIDLSQQTWGIYLVSVSNEDYKFVKKIVIK